jgi:putative ABC transport system permease protein
MVLGRGLARALGVGVGDPLILLASTRAGGISAVEGRVRGLFFTASKAFDDNALRLPIPLARSLLRTEGAHVWVVLLAETEATERFVTTARAALAGLAEAFEVTPWHALADFYHQTVRLFSAQMEVVRVIIGLIIVLSISNVLVMSVLERTAEIGTLMAVGLRRGAVLRLFVAEGLGLGLIGGGLGVALGSALALAISAVGIPMPPPPGMDTGFPGAIRLTPGLVAEGFLLAAATTLLASLYPAWKASRLAIVDALRHGR